MNTSALRALLLTALFGFLGFATLRAADEKPPEDLFTLIFDRAAFVSHLPKKTIVGINDLTSKEQAESLKRALGRLGRVPGVEYITLPKGVAAPKMDHWVAPVYPRNLPRPTDPHQSTFLVLVGPTGKPLLIYCTETTEQDIAKAAAKVMVQWTWTPSVIQQHPLPVLISVDTVVPPIE